MADPGLDRALDYEAVDHYLSYGYVPGELCILRGVKKLPAASAMEWREDSGSLRVFRYWQLPPLDEAAANTPVEDLTAQFESILEASVRRQLVADVPVGIMLSGGLDSSLVTALAARVSPGRVKTFTVSFPGHAAFDEGPFARRVAEHFGTDHTELRAEDAPVDLLPALARQFDEPLADSALVPTAMISRLIRGSATVALSGDGGDELFGGYPHYRWMLRAAPWRRAIPGWARATAAAASTAFLPLGARGRNHLAGFGNGASRSIAYINLYFDRATRERLMVPEVGANRRLAEPEAYRAGFCDAASGLVRQATAADFQTTLADGYLVKVDRASMLYGLEMRAPFLDREMIEFAFRSVPDALKSTTHVSKILPRRLAQRLLPPGLDLHRKQGFTMPLQSWFDGPWGRQAAEMLRDAPPALFQRKEIEALLRAQDRGYANTQRVFALTMFELWRREYDIHG
jgi:asparagine synthase (glutamine-hydrolysing)